MSQPITTITIVGGGTAGWLTAAIIAAKHKSKNTSGIEVVLVESSDIPTVGVGEGTWPTMRNTVREIGIKESTLFKHCQAAFKQGGKFVNWVHGSGDFYYHPFTVPLGYGRIDLAPYVSEIDQYAVQSNFQHHVCEAGLAPRTLSDQEYQGQANYAYHLDAGAFADLLKQHCRDELDVRQMVATVEKVNLDDQGAIASIDLQNGEQLVSDLYIDCTGFSSLLLGQKLGVPFISMDHVLFNNCALAMQIPYNTDDSPLASHTIATGQKAGWIWDIGLTSRRGVGHVYSNDYISDDAAEQILRDYIGPGTDDIEARKIPFNSGYRKQFWKNNCVAVGLSAGFVEPLEATAIMLVEISARFIADNLPPDSTVMPIIEKRFNQKMGYRWGRIIDFLKLHYMLTQRSEDYWLAHQQPSTIPESLQEDLAVWQYRGPIVSDFDSSIELFPAASYQYVMYGMGFKPNFDRQAHLYQQQAQAERIIQQNQQLTKQMLSTLPPHRQYIEHWLASAHSNN